MKQSHHRDVHFPSEQVPVCTGTPRLPVAAEDLCFSSLLREMKPEPPLPSPSLAFSSSSMRSIRVFDRSIRSPPGTF
jgi:hypothetical protein